MEEEEEVEEGGEGEGNPRKLLRGVGERGLVVRCVESGALAASGSGRPISRPPMGTALVGEELVMPTGIFVY